MTVPNPLRALPPGSATPVWASLAVIGAGFAAVLLGWSVVAGTDDASRQVAPTLGLGLGGLALVALGTVLLVVSVGRRDEVVLARVLRSGDAAHAVPVPHPAIDRPFLVCLAVAGLGLASMVLGASGAAREEQVAFARPYLVSGGFGGLSLLVAALGVLLARTRRRAALRRTLALEGLG